MKSHFISNSFKYDGSQLRSLFAYQNYSILGNSIVSWVGPCEVSFEHMVDGEDKFAGEKICGDQMLHFIIEVFDQKLIAAVTLQRLFATLFKDELVDLCANSSASHSKALQLKREGDDLYLQDAKLSISISTVSPVSAMIHFAVNVVNTGTPVKTCALKDFQISSEELANNVMKSFATEYLSIVAATQKVFWVK